MAELFERKPNPLYYANLMERSRVVINQGGTFSSKSYSIMQVLNTLAVSEFNLQITVAGVSIPKLKDDVMKIQAELVATNPNLARYVKAFNIQDRVYKFTTGSQIEFKSYEDAEMAKGAKMDYLYVSEATRFDYETFDILNRNAKVRTWIDYNPTRRFWVHDILLVNREQYPSVRLIRSWHEHNNYLSEEKHAEIERIQDPEMWKVYARGLTGKLSGLVFRWTAVHDWPTVGVAEVIWGIDWGYTNDPTVLTRVAVMQDGEYVVQELTYTPGLSSEVLEAVLRENGYHGEQPVYCDHDKEMILRLRRLGVLALPAEKGAQSILNRILYCKQKVIRYTIGSKNLANELGRYKFKEVDGVATNTPIDDWNHAIESATYAVFTHRNRLGRTEAAAPMADARRYIPQGGTLKPMTDLLNGE